MRTAVHWTPPMSVVRASRNFHVSTCIKKRVIILSIPFRIAYLLLRLFINETEKVHESGLVFNTAYMLTSFIAGYKYSLMAVELYWTTKIYKEDPVY